jgi:hypothetical protein
MTEEEIRDIAFQRAMDILECWWGEDTGEIGYIYDISEEDAERVVDCGYCDFLNIEEDRD